MFSITTFIIIITCLVSFTAFNNQKIKGDLLFWPYEIERRKQYYRFLSYGLIHADIMHLGFNMLTLYSFGEKVEKSLFARYDIFQDRAGIFYLVLYVTSIIVSTVPDYFNNKNNASYLALGASGAVSAVLFAGIMLEPKLSIYFIFIPFGIPGYIFGPAFLVISAYFARQGNSNIGHSAHITGAIYGLLFTIITTKLFAGYDSVGLFIKAIMNR